MAGVQGKSRGWVKMPLILEESLASSRLVACLCKLRDWCMSLSGAEFKVQSCHRQLSLTRPPHPLCRLSQGPVLPNFLAACPFGNLVQPRQGHSVWCSKPVQRGRLYVTLCFKHGWLPWHGAVWCRAAQLTVPTAPQPLHKEGADRHPPPKLIIYLSFKSFCLKLNFPRQLTKEEFSEFMNEWWIYCTAWQGNGGVYPVCAMRLCLWDLFFYCKRASGKFGHH